MRRFLRLLLRLRQSRFLCWALLLVVLTACQETAEVKGVPVNTETLFSDNFSEGSIGPWQLEADDLSAANISDGSLLINIDAPATVHYVTLMEPTFSDFVLEVDVTQLGGNPGSTYGVLIRMSGAQEFYRFEITGNGEYIVERHDGPERWTRLTDDWQTASALRQGLNATNHLTVSALGSTLSFYANYELLAEFSDGTYQEGTIALDAGTFSQTTLQVAFDNLVIQQP